DARGIPPRPCQHPPEPRHVVSGIDGVPVAADKGFEPAGEIAGSVGRLSPDVAEISGAIAGGNVHAAAECHCEMRIVAADALALAKHLGGRHRRAGMLITESDMTVNEVADRLN